MPKRRTKRKFAKKRFGRQTNPFANLPFRIVLDQHMFKLSHDVGNFSSGVGGTNTNVYNINNPSGAIEWAQMSALFDQYKVVKFKIIYNPLYTQADSAITSLKYAPMYICTDPDDTVVLASTSQALQYDNVRTVDLTRQWSHSHTNRTSSRTQQLAGWQDIAAVPTVNSIKFFVQNLSISQQYGFIRIEHICVFRGRR